MQKSACQKNGQTSDRASKAAALAVMPDVHVLSSMSSLKEITGRIREYSNNAVDNFAKIGADLKQLRDNPKILIDCGFADVYAYAQSYFGFGLTSTKNFIAVYEKFGSKSGGYVEIAGKYSGYSISQLIELVPVSGEIDKFSPAMTVKEIKDTKALDQAKKDEKALDEYVRKSFSAAISFLGQATLEKSDDSAGETVRYRFSGTLGSGGKPCKASGILSFEGGAFSASDLRLSASRIYEPVSGKAASSFSVSLRKAFESEAKYLKQQSRQYCEGPDYKEEKRRPERKEEWELWSEMTAEEKAESVSKDSVLNNKLNQFFVAKCFSYDAKSLLANATHWTNDDFFSPNGLIVIASLADKFGQKAKDVAFFSLTPEGTIAQVKNPVAFIEAAGAAKKAKIEAERKAEDAAEKAAKGAKAKKA